MFKFALKNMAIKKIQILLIVISIVLSCGIAVLAYNTGEQVSDGIVGNAGYYSAIIGPSGSATQLAMNTMYFTDSPLGTIPYSVVENLEMDTRVSTVIPYAMADSYNGYNIVGTTPAFLDGKEVEKGTMFASSYEIVLGYTVAKVCDVKVGDSVHTSHSASEEHTQAFTVVGILEETHTVYDKIVFTSLETLWKVHEEEEESGGEHHDHEEMDGSVCAILVKTKTPSDATMIVNAYNGRIYSDGDGDSFSLQAIEPMNTIRGVLEDADNTKYLVFILCAVILLMNIIIISVITLLNMLNAKKEIALMRLIGIGMNKINLLYLIENGLIGIVSTALAFGFSRILLLFMGDYVESMGVVLNIGKVYPYEFVILLAVFAISVLPTVICTSVMSKKDGMEG